eukprot:1158027-Pelagomonas_calceolata.AAC.9
MCVKLWPRPLSSSHVSLACREKTVADTREKKRHALEDTYSIPCAPPPPAWYSQSPALSCFDTWGTCETISASSLVTLISALQCPSTKPIINAPHQCSSLHSSPCPSSAPLTSAPHQCPTSVPLTQASNSEALLRTQRATVTLGDTSRCPVSSAVDCQCPTPVPLTQASNSEELPGTRGRFDGHQAEVLLTLHHRYSMCNKRTAALSLPLIPQARQPPIGTADKETLSLLPVS